MIKDEHTGASEMVLFCAFGWQLHGCFYHSWLIYVFMFSAHFWILLHFTIFKHSRSLNYIIILNSGIKEKEKKTLIEWLENRKSIPQNRDERQRKKEKIGQEVQSKFRRGNVKKKERTKWADDAPKNKLGWGSLRCCVNWSSKNVGHKKKKEKKKKKKKK